jgi:hypothetical protein
MTQQIQTRTLDRGPHDPAALVAARQLFVVIQAARPDAGGSRHALADLDEIEIGRGTSYRWRRSVDAGTRKLRIDVPDEWMSSVHAIIKVRVASALVADAGSKNGTVVNGKLVDGAELADGDIVETGRTVFSFAAAMPAPPDAAIDLGSAELTLPAGLRTLVPELAVRFDELARVAAAAAPVLVTGETGTGKELVARAVHELSRRTGPFVAVNCGAIAPALIESELFGHRRGAFSGATADRAGVIEASSGGTLFLDELGEIPERVQVALLRALQEREVMPVGASAPVRVDLRVVAATHRGVAGLREDLVARLRGFALELPPLRARLPDLGWIAGRLLVKLGAKSPELDIAAARALVHHAWRHNIRELERCLETALALAGDGPIRCDHIRLDAPAVTADPADPRRDELIALLTEHAGNVSAVASAVGKKRQQIQKWLRKYGIDPARYR